MTPRDLVPDAEIWTTNDYVDSLVSEATHSLSRAVDLEIECELPRALRLFTTSSRQSMNTGFSMFSAGASSVMSYMWRPMPIYNHIGAVARRSRGDDE